MTTNVRRTALPIRLLGAVLASSLLSLSVAATTHAEVIERVVAVVNDEAIFLSDLRQKAAPFLRRAMQAPTEAQRMQAVQQIYTQLLDRMIDERLILQAADEEDVTVSTSEVSTAIDNVRTQSGLEEREFWEAVRAQGFSPQQYRRDVRQQLLRLKVLNQRVRGRVNITEEDVRRRYDEMAVRARREATFEAEYIRLPLPADASATDIHQAMRDADDIRAGIETEEDFASAMDEHGGGETGRISERDLAPELSEVLLTLEEGEVSSPVRSEASNAVFILHLVNRDLASDALPAYDDVRMDIYREMMQEAMTRQEELFLEELRRRAIIERRLDQ
ncbi:Peptidylprolyl isomerase [Sandaracinus amylolyticus]|nr:Peptidylprolyl isomerase [Sandaracinus amylolyticus]